MREAIAAVFIIMGLIVFLLSIFGIFRFKYVLNRIHAAALGDTLGLASIVVGLMILDMNFFAGAKLFLIILFFWMSGPIATHSIAKVEVLTNKSYEERVREK
ncbi:Na(+)/H(+) antiporter subunit G [Anaerotignum neopropionicum]|mgnify:CR=1 FL=1|uniref:Na(+)/H(+) antiporter subunit G n=1 Tax=Anaerotignum neopropionicum TaxID=36847 RepID=A0A136WFU2_9FIRM|nr:monovalent cation/H(+) antiporter subunit G [Anaerotignum neopropionicum]KXL53327.1 Na(+)/H(+) antiporter subunit G [Anaerotignum neopropionicum]